MAFRVTLHQLQNQATLYSTQHNSDIFQLQQQLSSGLRFTRASQAPLAFKDVSRLSDDFSQLQVELETIRNTESILNTSVSRLVSANEVLTSINVLVSQGISTTEPADFEALALEAEGALGQIQAIANTEFNGEFLFAGNRTSRKPYDFSSPAYEGRPLNTEYSGTNVNGQVRVSDQIFIDNYFNGELVFGRGEREPTILIGSTGAQPGAGTDTVEGRANLDITRGPTTITGTSGIALGDAVENDEVIGEFQITLVDTSGTGTSGTISINGGDPINFDNTQSNLQLNTEQGQTFTVDTTAITPGYSGTFSIAAGGFLSVDGGATQTAIDFSSNQVVVDADGERVNIDSTGIVRTGTDYLEFPGTSNVFQVIDNAISDFRANRDLSAAELSNSLGRVLDAIDGVRDRILSTTVQQSTLLRTMEGVGFRKEQLSLEIQTQASDIQGTDFASAALQLTNAQALLEYSFAVTARINSTNILDFLR